jgi:hypothetical protein
MTHPTRIPYCEFHNPLGSASGDCPKCDTPGGIDNAAEPLHARIAELRLKYNEAVDIAKHGHEVVLTLRARLAAAERERNAMKAALEEYGKHWSICPTSWMDETRGCNCGLSAALRGEAAS